MEGLHEDFIKELQDLLARYDADISLNTNMYDEEIIQIDFNSTDKREYSNIRLHWIDKDDLAIEE